MDTELAPVVGHSSRNENWKIIYYDFLELNYDDGIQFWLDFGSQENRSVLEYLEKDLLIGAQKNAYYMSFKTQIYQSQIEDLEKQEKIIEEARSGNNRAKQNEANKRAEIIEKALQEDLSSAAIYEFAQCDCFW